MRIFILSFIAVFISLGAQAVELKGNWGFGVDYGVPLTQNDDAFDDAYANTTAGELKGKWSGNAHLRYHIGRKTALELAYDHFEMKDLAFGVEGYTLNFLYAFSSPATRWFNYINLGAGSSEVKDSVLQTDGDDSYFATTFKVGFGFEYFISNRFNIGLNLDYHFIAEDAKDTDFDIFSPSVSVTYYFGPGAADDMDKDHIYDEYDKCPDTPANEEVDDVGCSDSQKDSDNDGVSDRDDKCADSPQTEKVDAYGCSPSQVDSDNDGISDMLDQCPNTGKGKRVNSAGCTEKETVEITLNVQFKSGKTEIDPRYDSELEKVATFLKTYEDTKAEIEGHSDSTGSREWNTKLSQQRADSVKNYLVEKFQIDSDRLTSVGYGPDKPIADNATVEGRKLNRRVVATFKTK
ncbi:MAG: OmpA family protein [Halobacteriovoraceae bacterium]|nr:OmpA family protein [Halobacteriovoraceae bacterium]MCB9093536.1 OmpA family protein [Halobacteriovoraceae bacterium]